MGWGDGWLNGVANIQDEVWDAREGGDGRMAAYLGGSIAVSMGSLRASGGAVGYGEMQGNKEMSKGITRGESSTRREGKICRRKKQTNAEEEEEMNATTATRDEPTRPASHHHVANLIPSLLRKFWSKQKSSMLAKSLCHSERHLAITSNMSSKNQKRKAADIPEETTEVQDKNKRHRKDKRE